MFGSHVDDVLYACTPDMESVMAKIKDALNKYVQSKTISATKKKGITVGSTEIFQGQGRRSAAISVAIEHVLTCQL